MRPCRRDRRSSNYRSKSCRRSRGIVCEYPSNAWSQPRSDTDPRALIDRPPIPGPPSVACALPTECRSRKRLRWNTDGEHDQSHADEARLGLTEFPDDGTKAPRDAPDPGRHHAHQRSPKGPAANRGPYRRAVNALKSRLPAVAPFSQRCSR